MVRKKFKGIRRRVEGDRAAYAVAAVEQKGFTITRHARLGDDTGYAIRTKEGSVINLYDTGTITVTGNNRHLFRDREALRMPNTVNGVFIVAANDDNALLTLGLKVQEMGLPVTTAVFTQPSWMKKVALARRRGMHILALISAGSECERSSGSLRDQLDASFGLGLLVARLEREHLTVIWDDGIAMPNVYGLLGANLIRYQGSISVVDHELRERFSFNKVAMLAATDKASAA